VSSRALIPEIVWWGRSWKEYLRWPCPIREDFDQALADLQEGRIPRLDRAPMKSIGAGVFELKDQDSGKWYRLIYRERIKGRIFILRCFEKQSKKTAKKDLRAAETRLAEVSALLQQEEKDEKQRDRSRN
jgi:phage-related protein